VHSSRSGVLRATDGPNFMRTYECLFDWTGLVQIVRWNGSFGDVTFLPISDYRALGRPLVTRDVVKATIVGNTIRLYINGQQLAWTVDSAIASGQPEISFFIRPGGSQRLLGLTSFSASSPQSAAPRRSRPARGRAAASRERLVPVRHELTARQRCE
jgi:hypothetical protein